MKKLINAVTTAFDMIYRILLEYSKLVLLVIVFIVSAQVISRKFLGTSIRWSEEVALLLMVWMAFISMAIGVEKKLHIAITMFYDMFPKTLRWILEKINFGVIFAFGVVLINYGIKLINSTSTSTLPATKWPASTLYLMMPVGGLFICYFTILDFFKLDQFRHRKIEGGDE
ncbi:TRAP transporter small permease [Marasmitruncus massiliensis]|uniref:TRAP transporter small permease n=1 Tax=Marasmitruncus massiliensis TaxID=1944642 RepID=UPI001A9A6182|nr:TRAP transporter small permease [Marasmitruncus massiliensis]